LSIRVIESHLLTSSIRMTSMFANLVSIILVIMLQLIFLPSRRDKYLTTSRILLGVAVMYSISDILSILSKERVTLLMLILIVFLYCLTINNLIMLYFVYCMMCWFIGILCTLESGGVKVASLSGLTVLINYRIRWWYWEKNVQVIIIN
jgi:hypothetical protein